MLTQGQGKGLLDSLHLKLLPTKRAVDCLCVFVDTQCITSSIPRLRPNGGWVKSSLCIFSVFVGICQYLNTQM